MHHDVETTVALMAERDAVDARAELAFDCLPDAGFNEAMHLYDYAQDLIAEGTALRSQIRELLET
jgi:hypothetical protein